MKPILLTSAMPGAGAPLDAKVDWLMKFAQEVIRNSKIDALMISDAYTITNRATPPVRALNVSTATTAQVAEVFGQFLADLQARGPKNG